MSVPSPLQVGLKDSDLPALHRSADDTSLRGQSSYLGWTRCRLILVVIAAVAGLLDFTNHFERTEPRLFALVAVLAFLAALGAEIYLLSARPDQLWYYGRAIAESVKTLSWRYAMDAQPFTNIADDDTDAVMIARLTEIVRESPVAGDLSVQAGQHQITPVMRELRQAEFPVQRAAYLKGRVDEQIRWYTEKARYNQYRTNFWRFTMVALELAGAVAALLLLIHVIDIPMEGVFASVIAGSGAWLEVKQFESVANAYTLTATELSLAREDGEAVAAEDHWPDYVAATEDAISKEHTMWLVRRVRTRFGPR